MSRQVTVERDGAVAVFKFANPPKNFIGNVMLREFHGELI